MENTEFCATSGKIVLFKYLCNCTSIEQSHALLTTECGGDLFAEMILQLLFVAITHGKASLWLWKSLLCGIVAASV